MTEFNSGAPEWQMDDAYGSFADPRWTRGVERVRELIVTRRALLSMTEDLGAPWMTSVAYSTGSVPPLPRSSAVMMEL